MSSPVRRNSHIISSDTRLLISARYKRITRAINSEFWNSSSETDHSLYVGSYGRNTAINTSDHDLIATLKNRGVSLPDIQKVNYQILCRCYCAAACCKHQKHQQKQREYLFHVPPLGRIPQCIAFILAQTSFSWSSASMSWVITATNRPITANSESSGRCTASKSGLKARSPSG